MLKVEVEKGPNGRIILMDSITKVTADDVGTIVVSASHGGASSGEFACEVPLKIVFFNDAGVGKDDAGIAALSMLQKRGVAAGATSHTSGRIGEAQDMWDHGEISHLNDAAKALGLTVGGRLRDQLQKLVRSGL